MDTDYIQHVRYKLQKRLKRLNTADYNYFHNVLASSWDFLQQNSLIKGILDDLENRSSAQECEANKIISGQPLLGTTEAEVSGISYWVIKKCALSPNRGIAMEVGRPLSNSNQFNDHIESFRLVYLEPLFDYIDEQLDDKRMVLALLLKYKHRCEWFRRDPLLKAFGGDTKKGEEILAYDLYEYLHDQGLQFHIEPQSASGRPDLVADQTGPDRFVADVKIFNPDTSHPKSYIVKGYRQVYDYAKDHNEPFGYLVIFKTSEKDLIFPACPQEASVPFVTINNRTVFLLVVDIYPYEDTASKRGKLAAEELMPDEFVRVLASPENPAPPIVTIPTSSAP